MQEKNEPNAIIVRENEHLSVRENEIERKMKEMINFVHTITEKPFF
jgi:hypothetical protein